MNLIYYICMSIQPVSACYIYQMVKKILRIWTIANFCAFEKLWPHLNTFAPLSWQFAQAFTTGKECSPGSGKLCTVSAALNLSNHQGNGEMV